MSSDLRKWGVGGGSAGAPAPAPASGPPKEYLSFWELFFGERLIKRGKEVATKDVLGRTKVMHVCVVLGSSWSKPCAAFTPGLAKFYEKAEKSACEVIYVALDRDEAAFDKYTADMPWLVVPFAGCRAVKKDVARALNAEHYLLDVALHTGSGARDKASPFEGYKKHAGTIIELHEQSLATTTRAMLQKRGICGPFRARQKLADISSWPPAPPEQEKNNPHEPYFLSKETVEEQIKKGKPKAPWEGGPHAWSFKDGVIPPNFGIRKPKDA